MVTNNQLEEHTFVCISCSHTWTGIIAAGSESVFLPCPKCLALTGSHLGIKSVDKKGFYNLKFENLE